LATAENHGEEVFVTEPLPESEKKKKPEGPDAPILSTPGPAPLHRFRWVLFLFVAAFRP
jgi:hypothetical protein